MNTYVEHIGEFDAYMSPSTFIKVETSIPPKYFRKHPHDYHQDDETATKRDMVVFADTYGGLNI